MRKLTVLAIGGIGYVLGARAGRERYEQIREPGRAGEEQPKSPGEGSPGGRRRA